MSILIYKLEKSCIITKISYMLLLISLTKFFKDLSSFNSFVDISNSGIFDILKIKFDFVSVIFPKLDN